MMGGNHGRAPASSTMAAIQASSLSSAVPGPSAMARARDADGAEHVAEDLEVEAVLAAVVVVEHRLVDARLGGDAVDAGGVVAALGELAGGGGKDRGLGIAGGAAADGLVY